MVNSDCSVVVERLSAIAPVFTLGWTCDCGLPKVDVYHASKHPTSHHTSTIHSPDVILRTSFTRPSTALAVIEGLGTRPVMYDIYIVVSNPNHWRGGLGLRLFTLTVKPKCKQC